MTEQYDAIGARFEESKSTAAFSAADTFTLSGALGDVTGLSALDLACGYGYNTRLLAERGAGPVVGVDVSVEMVRLAQKYEARSPTGVDYVIADVTDLPPLPHRFDLATAVYLFNYASSRAALRSMFRGIHAALADHGRLLAIVPNPTPFPEGNYEEFGLRILERVPGEEVPLIRQEFTTDPPTPLEDYEWQLADYELAATQAGFPTVRWSPIRTPPPDGVRDEKFWQRYRDHPVSRLMTCDRR
ncbi:class I SAM-dependent methyltransferase [Umezawaea endophytica]|uniref:Class I SAM-dependent methyltransferase n=1 Tax=Umezawaea endophytica TaxID=1654476 RepID=A0A9X2VKT7_9PSEU|nr:class I SAM-dependent methyltransferase [Umezawaea endophytica]MCS7477954.1 class I SAM-dependent methyltransferase [Umezawaea endophytica]